VYGFTALLFFGRPLAQTSSPRNTLIGHAVATGDGVFSLAVVGWQVNRTAVVPVPLWSTRVS
jgi:hypothetical protein